MEENTKKMKQAEEMITEVYNMLLGVSEAFTINDSLLFILDDLQEAIEGAQSSARRSEIKMSEVKITERDFENYVRVQKEGRFNMFDPQARQLTGLTEDKYFDIIHNYSQYKEKFSK